MGLFDWLVQSAMRRCQWSKRLESASLSFRYLFSLGGIRSPLEYFRLRGEEIDAPNENNKQQTNGAKMEHSPVTEFYRDRNVFITGATGFLGKVLVEKLLRSCPDIKTLYLLIRPKSGKDIRIRIQEFAQHAVHLRLILTIHKLPFREKKYIIISVCLY